MAGRGAELLESVAQGFETRDMGLAQQGATAEATRTDLLRLRDRVEISLTSSDLEVVLAARRVEEEVERARGLAGGGAARAHQGQLFFELTEQEARLPEVVRGAGRAGAAVVDLERSVVEAPQNPVAVGDPAAITVRLVDARGQPAAQGNPAVTPAFEPPGCVEGVEVQGLEGGVYRVTFTARTRPAEGNLRVVIRVAGRALAQAPMVRVEEGILRFDDLTAGLVAERGGALVRQTGTEEYRCAARSSIDVGSRGVVYWKVRFGRGGREGFWFLVGVSGHLGAYRAGSNPYADSGCHGWLGEGIYASAGSWQGGNIIRWNPGDVVVLRLDGAARTLSARVNRDVGRTETRQLPRQGPWYPLALPQFTGTEIELLVVEDEDRF
jgi:hypothetical protein